MEEAILLAGSADVPASSNPRVGCVIVDSSGAIVGRGHHRGSGTPHAEVVALADAGSRALGATAVVTLEPCNHTGRTGPCTEALLDAGITRVVYGISDPGPESGGGAGRLADAGMEVISGVCAKQAHHVARAWFHSRRLGRPLVTLKAAVSLDGRVSDATGGPTAITGAPARALSHEWRHQVDAIVVGTGTALADDPSLTARDFDGQSSARQPLRVVVGNRPVPGNARVCDDSAPTLLHADHDLAELLDRLHERDVQHVLVEGGPTLAAAFVQADLVDEVLWFIAPVLLGEGAVSLPAGIPEREVSVRTIRVVGEDVVIEGVVERAGDVHRDR